MGPVSQFAGAGTPDGDAVAIQALHADRRFQFAFPDADKVAPPPGWLVRLLHFIDLHALAFRNIGWGLLAILVLVAGFFIVRIILRHYAREDQVAAPRPVPLWQPSIAQARALLRHADALAADGSYTEAAHALLLVAVQEIQDRRPGAVVPAFTSREIARRPELSDKARGIFSEIAAVVEVAVFGARALTAADFARCRHAFEQFTAAESWSAAA